MATKERHVGRAAITQPSGTEVETTIHINELDGGRHRVRIRNFGEGEVQMDDSGRFSDEPFAYGGQLNRARGVVERGPEGSLRGHFNVERDGEEVARGSFRARKRA